MGHYRRWKSRREWIGVSRNRRFSRILDCGILRDMSMSEGRRYRSVASSMTYNLLGSVIRASRCAILPIILFDFSNLHISCVHSQWLRCTADSSSSSNIHVTAHAFLHTCRPLSFAPAAFSFYRFKVFRNFRILRRSTALPMMNNI